MSNRNCINCGAVVDAEKAKCPFCGTSYFDFTDVDLDSPVILKIKYKGNIVSLKAFCSFMEIAMQPEYVTCAYDVEPIKRMLVNSHTTINLTFEEVKG